VGEVVGTGEAASLFQPGDLVYYAGDLNRQGSNAEYQLVDERLVGSKPKSLSDAEAAALPLTSITAWELLFEHLAIQQQNPIVKNNFIGFLNTLYWFSFKAPITNEIYDTLKRTRYSAFIDFPR